MIISNRSGTVESNLYRDETEKPIYELPLARNCFYPFYQTLIDYNGDMILCPHDWEKKYIVGNLSDSHIWDLWKSKKYEGARKMLSNKHRNFSPCVNCDVKGDVMGDINYEYWRNRQR